MRTIMYTNEIQSILNASQWLRAPRGPGATRWLYVALLAGLLAACGTPKRGAYYQDDGPGRTPVDVQAIPDAVPRIEPFAQTNLRPYVVAGRRYTPIADNRGFRQEGLASWYGQKFHGQPTANGEIYDMYAMTAAHPTLPIPSYARVTRKATGQSVIVRVNDRGPFHSIRIMDLSYAAAAKLGVIEPGVAPVIVEAISHDQIRGNDAPPPTQTAALPPPPPAQTAALPSPPPRQTTALPSPPTQQKTAPRANTKQIFLQFGAFSISENAYRLADRINQSVQQTATVQRGSDDLHRVLIGPYPSRAAALAAARTIQERTGLLSSIARH